MDSFALCPLQSGYQPQPYNPVLEQALLGGFARQRVNFINGVHVVSASVMLPSQAYAQYFWAFWRKHAQYALSPFLWRLTVDDVEMTDYQCQFIPDSLKIGERNGTVYSASFSVRCKPKPANLAFDQSIIDTWLNGNGLQTVNLLAKLVNQDLPNALGKM